MVNGLLSAVVYLRAARRTCAFWRIPCRKERYLLRADDRQENVVEDLDGVDVEEALFRGHVLEVDGVREGPHGPRADHARHEIVLDLGRDLVGGRSGRYTDPSEENQGEDGCPHELIDDNLVNVTTEKRGQKSGGICFFSLYFLMTLVMS